MELINHSPFSIQSLVLLDNNGKETLLVVAKASYAIDRGTPRFCDKQEAIRMADEYYGEPGSSSIRFAGETSLHKPATDVILLGSAYPPGRRQRVVDVVLQAGRIRKSVRVFGDRHWEGTSWLERMSEPLPFERMPLLFERAFGGIDDSNPDAPESEPRNPVGVGFRARRSNRPLAGTPLPNLENPEQLIRSASDRVEPAGTGFVAPHWEPRRSRAGTYDARWRQERAPFLPDDYSPVFQQAAPVDQVCPGYMQGGEPVHVENASPKGRLDFRLPESRPEVSVRMGEDLLSLPMKLDTVVIDGDDCILRMIWRAGLSVHNRIYDVSSIRVAALEEE
jgi:hypothetical protein